MKTSNAMARKLGNNKGFTLIEMAIVLVIIGIIIGAVVKGQDLIANARAKQLVSAVNTWRSLAYAYMDRNGRLPGDASRNGVIGDSTASTPSEQADTGSSISELATTMQNAPTNPVVIGSMSFWIYFGNTAAATPGRNALIICKDVACANLFTADELEMIRSVDTALDGVADAGLGQFRAVATAPTTTALTAVPTTNQVNRVVTVATPVDATPGGATTAWATADHRAAVWAFERPF